MHWGQSLLMRHDFRAGPFPTALDSLSSMLCWLHDGEGNRVICSLLLAVSDHAGLALRQGASCLPPLHSLPHPFQYLTHPGTKGQTSSLWGGYHHLHKGWGNALMGKLYPWAKHPHQGQMPGRYARGTCTCFSGHSWLERKEKG